MGEWFQSIMRKWTFYNQNVRPAWGVFEHSHGKPCRSGTFRVVGLCFNSSLTFLFATDPLKVFTFIHYFDHFVFSFQNLFDLAVTTWPLPCLGALRIHPHLLTTSSPPILQWPLDLYRPPLFPVNPFSIDKKTANWTRVKLKK